MNREDSVTRTPIQARNKYPIVVAGGGIGGLAAALALALREFNVVVCEKAPQFGQVGAGLQVAPNALSALDALGVGERVKQRALLIERMSMRDAVSGNLICDIPCGAEFRRLFNNPYAVAHRADVHGALLDGCRQHPNKISLRADAGVTGFSMQKHGVDVFFSSGESLKGSSLIGADGIRSVVRQYLIGDGEPEAAGAIIFRALIPVAQMPQRHQKPYPTMWAGPGFHIIYYPVSDWTMFNLGVTINADASAYSEGLADPAEVIELLRDCCDEPLEVVQIPKSFQRYIIRHRQPIANWSQGVVTLLGDAAHPMVQYIAQGAAMALEDAMCLAEAVNDASGDIAEAFRQYQAVRIVRSARVQISSLLMDRIYHASGVERLVRNSMFELRTAAEYYDRLQWLYRAPDYVGFRVRR
jgi:salicylate hydroxylase